MNWIKRHRYGLHILMFLVIISMMLVSGLCIDWLQTEGDMTKQVATRYRIGVAVTCAVALWAMIRETNRHFKAKEKWYEDKIRRH